jgi:Uma2 family endonuclease
MGLAQRDNDYHTYGDYLSWAEDTRYELVDGVAYLMAPAPAVSHQEVTLEIASQLKTALHGHPCRVLIAPVDVRLPKANETDELIDTVIQPDVLAVCDPAKISERGVRGAPDWILEVLSPSTAGHDQVRKRRIYEQAGVREYWMVHPTDRVLTIYRLENGAYGKPDTQVLEGETPIAVLPGVTIAWDELVKRLPKPEF